jgi:hypothetical protein
MKKEYVRPDVEEVVLEMTTPTLQVTSGGNDDPEFG